MVPIIHLLQETHAAGNEHEQGDFLDLSDLDDEPELMQLLPDENDNSENNQTDLDSEDEDYDAGRVDSDDEDDNDVEEAEAIAEALLEEVEEPTNIDYRNPYQPVDR